MNDKLQGIWKEVVAGQLKYYLGICMEGLRKTAKCQNRCCPGRDSNQAPPEYGTRSTCSVAHLFCQNSEHVHIPLDIYLFTVVALYNNRIMH
jgi:hypothetical protein